MSKSRAWISGWGVSIRHFSAACQRAFPEDRHQVFEPGPNGVTQALASGTNFIGAYSLGTRLLLQSIEQVPASTEILLLAPITGFCQEHALGGKTPFTSLQMLQRRLEQSPLKALKLFYRLADLKNEPCKALPYSVDSLQWGLTQLEKPIQHFESHRKMSILIGEQDPLLNSSELSIQFRNAHSVDAGHDYHNLLSAAAVVQSNSMDLN